jgi:hypothetical protein
MAPEAATITSVGSGQIVQHPSCIDPRGVSGTGPKHLEQRRDGTSCSDGDRAVGVKGEDAKCPCACIISIALPEQVHELRDGAGSSNRGRIAAACGEGCQCLIWKARRQQPKGDGAGGISVNISLKHRPQA